MSNITSQCRGHCHRCRRRHRRHRHDHQLRRPRLRRSSCRATAHRMEVHHNLSSRYWYEHNQSEQEVTMEKVPGDSLTIYSNNTRSVENHVLFRLRVEGP